MKLIELSSRFLLLCLLSVFASFFISLWGPVDRPHQGSLGFRGRGGAP